MALTGLLFKVYIMTYIPENKATVAVNTDPGGRTRVSQLTTLFDGKVLDTDDSRLWETLGTGTQTFNQNQMEMSVTSGQYVIRRGRYKTPYASGKPQLIEVTADNFGTDENTNKMMGYFSSSTIAPYDTAYDGVWIENNSGDISLKASRFGTETINVPFTSWDNYDRLQSYNWDNFTVVLFDFLWLGGTEVRLFIKTDEGFVLAHTAQWAGIAENTFIGSPAHSVRYEIRSTTGTGRLDAVCSQVATEGDINQIGKNDILVRDDAVTTNTVGTLYAIKSFKMRSDRKNIPFQITDATITNSSTNDIGQFFIVKNPTLSAAIPYVNNGNIQDGTPGAGDGITLTAGTGDYIAAANSGEAGAASGLANNFLAYLGSTAADVSDEFVLAYMPTTANQSVFGTMTIKEY